MARVTCPCLNVSVFITGEWQGSPVSTGKLFPEGGVNVEGGLVYEVNLDVAGIVVEVKVLVRSCHVGDWVIHSCTNCKTDVYITHAVKGDRTFVLPGVLSDTKAIESICQGKEYSSIFKILLRPVQDDTEGEVFRRKRVSSMSFGREDPDMKLVHQQMKQYLQLEEEAMEERIRSFERLQRESFMAQQARAHHERSLLFAVIAKARDNIISEEIKSTHLESERDVHTVTSAIKDIVKTKAAVQKPNAQRVTITFQDNAAYPQSQQLPLPSDEDSLFALEGFDEEQVYVGESTDDGTNVGDIAFPQSDDEDSSTNDSSFRDVSALSGINLATSVPVSIPLFKRTSEPSVTPPSNGDEDVLDVRGDVGDSIRQLALSVQDTGMFGDLPRPRMMTNPFS